VNWEPRAAQLAAAVTHPASRWRPAVAAVPRHLFAPRWWAWTAPGDLWHDHWELRDGPADPAVWLDAAYADRSLITQVGTLHADHAGLDDHPAGRPTSSSTMPKLLVQMYRHAMISDSADVLDAGTGTGYGTALLVTRLSDDRVTSIDVDPYLVKAATERLDSIGLHPAAEACDATGPLPGGPGRYDRIIATVAVRPVPASWLAALKPGGRLVTTITGTNLILTADKTPDGGAAGRTEWDRAGFMHTRSGPGYPPAMRERLTEIRDAEGDQVTSSPYPVVNVSDGWELYSTLGLVLPGVEDHYEERPDGTRTAWLLHPDGSWARATATADQPPIVHQSGPRSLWNTLDALRADWLRDGSLPAYGANVTISPDGSLHFQRGRWTADIPAG
jgi:protein-L-isoaspartate O-methyltransferase